MEQGKNSYTSYVFTSIMLSLCIIMPVQALDLDATCNNCLQVHYQSACDNIIKVWTILDLLRSITITSEARATFAHQMFDDSVAVMHDMSALESSCQFCNDYYKRHTADLIYLEEIIAHVSEAFFTVFTPALKGEEKLLVSVMINIVQSMEHIQKEVGITLPSKTLFKNAL